MQFIGGPLACPLPSSDECEIQTYGATTSPRSSPTGMPCQPRPRCPVRTIQNILKTGLVVGGCRCRRPLADQTIGLIHGDMVLVAERRDGEVDRWKRSVLLRLGFCIFDRPACIPVPLGETRPLLLPAIGNPPLLDGLFSTIVLRGLDAATVVASTIWPLFARNPDARRTSSNRLNR